MGTGDDPEDYVYLGTPLEREDELGFRKRKLALEKGQARRVAPWQQEVITNSSIWLVFFVIFVVFS